METETVAVTRVTPWEIKERLERGEPLWFVDARNPQAWSESDEKVPGAIRVPTDDASATTIGSATYVPKARSPRSPRTTTAVCTPTPASPTAPSRS